MGGDGRRWRFGSGGRSMGDVDPRVGGERVQFRRARALGRDSETDASVNRTLRPVAVLVVLLLSPGDGVGQSWSAGPAMPPSMAAGDYVSATDSGRGCIVYWGTGTGATWELGASGWRSGPGGPPPRVYTDLAYRRSEGTTWLFGGSRDGFDPERDVWTYDGTAWTQVGDGEWRMLHAMGYDPHRDAVVALGGQDPFVGCVASALALTGQYPDPPVPRCLAGLAFGPEEGGLVLYGGSDNFSASLDDTWIFDGAGWRAGPAAPPAMPARRAHAMALDEARGRIVVFGGLTSGGVPVNDTWELAGGGWTRGAPAPPGLTPRSQAALTFLPSRQGMVLLGGHDGAAYLSETWIYDSGCPLVELAPEALPPAKVGFGYGVGVTAQGGTGPYRFEVWGALPPGLTLSPSGSVSGTPTTPGTYSFTLSAEDATGCRGSRDYRLRVLSAELHDVVVGRGTGPGSPNQMRVFDPLGLPAPVDVTAYAAGSWGVWVSSADLDLGGFDELLTGPGPGEVLGPHLRGFSRSGAPLARVNWYAYGTLKYGVHPGAADLEGDAYAEILTSPGPGAVFGPHVRAWNFDAAQLSPIASVNFFAYGTLRFGAEIGGGDVDSDHLGEILTGAGPGGSFAATVRGWNHDGSTLAPMAKLDFNAFSLPGGVVVSVGDVDVDGGDEILTASGANPSNPARIAGFDYDGGVAPLLGLAGTPLASYYGARVGVGDVRANGVAEIMVSAGPDPGAGAVVSLHQYDGVGLTPWLAFDAFVGAAYGANATGGVLGY